MGHGLCFFVRSVKSKPLCGPPAPARRVAARRLAARQSWIAQMERREEKHTREAGRRAAASRNPSVWESVRPWLESTSAKVAGNRQSPQGYRGHLTLERVSPTRWARSSLCSSKSNCESFLPEGPCGGPKDSPNTNMQSNNAITLAIEMPYRAVGATTRAQISMAPTTTTA